MIAARTTVARMAISVDVKTDVPEESLGINCNEDRDSDSAGSPDINLASPKQYMFQSLAPTYNEPL